MVFENWGQEGERGLGGGGAHTKFNQARKSQVMYFSLTRVVRLTARAPTKCWQGALANHRGFEGSEGSSLRSGAGPAAQVRTHRTLPCPSTPLSVTSPLRAYKP